IGVEPLGHSVRTDWSVLHPVVFGALLGVAQHRVCGVDFLELLRLRLVAAGSVRMVFLRQLAVGFLDGVLVGGFRNAERLVEVFHGGVGWAELVWHLVHLGASPSARACALVLFGPQLGLAGARFAGGVGLVIPLPLGEIERIRGPLARDD